jgi:hypothetical protein
MGTRWLWKPCRSSKRPRKHDQYYLSGCPFPTNSTNAELILQQAERSTLGIQLTLPGQKNTPRGYRAGLIRELTLGGPAFLSDQVKVALT